MDKNTKIWQLFVEYLTLIGAESKESGLDIYGTEQITNMAINLTQAHVINEVNDNIQSLFVADSEIGGQC